MSWKEMGESLIQNALLGEESMLDWFIPPSQANDMVTLSKSRILIGTTTVILLLLLMACAAVYGLIGIQSPDANAALIVMLPMCFILLAILCIFKKTGAYQFCAHLMVFAGYLGVVTGMIFTGGPFESLSLFVIALPVLLGFCLLGLGAGIVWSVLVFATVIIMMMLDLNGVMFIDVSNNENERMLKAVIWSIGVVMTAAILVIYEKMQLRLQFDLERFMQMATHDHLTALPNRLIFKDRMALAIRRAKREKSKFAVLYLDLNGFKPINDNHGHKVGDYVLQTVADRMLETLRSTDLVARVGGDEFVVLLESIDDDCVDTVAAKLLSAIEQPIDSQGVAIQVGASVGVSYYPENGSDIDDLITYADNAMYVVKRRRDAHVHSGVTH